jgi:hypothetical protein
VGHKAPQGGIIEILADFPTHVTRAARKCPRLTALPLSYGSADLTSSAVTCEIALSM